MSKQLSHAQKQPSLQDFLTKMRTKANFVPNPNHETRKDKNKNMTNEQTKGNGKFYFYLYLLHI